MTRLLDRIDRPQDLHGLDRGRARSRSPRRSASTSSTRSARSAGTSAPTSAPASSPSRCTRCSTRPRDKILWDVGHQAYPHKVLTGRRDELADDPPVRAASRRSARSHESEHDIMGAGHASTVDRLRGRAQGGRCACSATADDGQRRRRHRRRRDDRRRRLRGDPPGRRPRHADRRRAQRQRHVDRAERRRAVALLQPRPAEPEAAGTPARASRAGSTELPGGIGARFERLGPQLKESIKAFWAPGLFWEELDWAYVGVVDGHDVARAARARSSRRSRPQRPVVVHIATVKGKGFAPAEEGGLEGMEKWHAAKPNSIADGAPVAAKPAPRTPRPSRRSTRRCSATRWSARSAATAASSASPPR